ncbi:hypothetical protein C2845_PM06G35260 [Panicum miliaceum]|uniref:AB hydrolase-1 domain-containing protein n=1 Tax=Panicum miliaceum TaxID=4540 RepID=A0A3L6R825_PANMI|nr:hypothetical protein C2845_PM06G35260 [Panicum miliaceum]
MDAGEVRHWNVDVNGVSIHVAEQGPADGTAVLLLHGFPELWFSWRHQMAALAARGFRALAPDLRGYGESSVPDDPAAYSIFHLVGDVVALLDHLQLTKVPPFLFASFQLTSRSGVIDLSCGVLTLTMDASVGVRCRTRLGSPGGVAWLLCLFRPDRVRAVVALGVPYFPRHPRPMTEVFAAFGDGFYMTQFQITSLLLLEWRSDFLEASPSPLPWIAEEELIQYAEKFQKSGFTGPLNYYRMAETNWRLLAPWNGAKITVPAKFIAGDKDIGVQSFGIEQYIKSGGFKSNVPELEVAIIDGHHFLQQEQAERVNSEILSYLDKFTSE